MQHVVFSDRSLGLDMSLQLLIKELELYSKKYHRIKESNFNDSTP